MLMTPPMKPRPQPRNTRSTRVDSGRGRVVLDGIIQTALAKDQDGQHQHDAPADEPQSTEYPQGVDKPSGKVAVLVVARPAEPSRCSGQAQEGEEGEQQVDHGGMMTTPE